MMNCQLMFLFKPKLSEAILVPNVLIGVPFAAYSLFVVSELRSVGGKMEKSAPVSTKKRTLVVLSVTNNLRLSLAPTSLTAAVEVGFSFLQQVFEIRRALRTSSLWRQTWRGSNKMAN